jgi:membrane protein
VKVPRVTREEVLAHPTFLRLRATRPGQLATSLYEINLRDRALTLAGQAFIALVPLLIVLATAASGSDGKALADYLIDKFHLTGGSADAVSLLFERPPDSRSGLSFVGLVILLISFSSFARSMQRTYEVAWRLPARGFRRSLRGVAGSMVLLATFVLMAMISARVDALPAGPVLAVAVDLACAVPAWMLISRLMLGARVSWSRLAPGAVVSALAQVLVGWGGSLWVPHLIERNAGRYGVIGVAVALISWLVVLAFLLVASAVIGAQFGRWLSQEDDASPRPSGPGSGTGPAAH